MNQLLQSLAQEFDKLRDQVVQPAEGLLKYDYLIPGGFYKQMWDWDGFFIGIHLATRSREKAKYLKWWVLNYVDIIDKRGYASGCITPEGARKELGKFFMKPFLAQGCYFASAYSGDFTWIKPIYNRIKKVIAYREKTQLDEEYGLFFWENALQSGADNNPALSNVKKEKNAVLACDINTFQLREYISLSKICKELGFEEDERLYNRKIFDLTKSMEKHLWFDKNHSFFNIRRDTGEPIKKIVYSNFIPLIQNLVQKELGEKMIQIYLWNSSHMLSDFGLRSLSVQDDDYNNESIIMPYSNWQGPIWPIANFLYSIILKNYGFTSEVEKLSGMLGELCLKDIEQCGTMHENYHAETGEPLAPCADHSSNGKFRGFIGWNLLVQNMLEGAVMGNYTLLNL